MDGALWSEDDRLSVLDVATSLSGGGGDRDIVMLWESEGERMHLLYSTQKLGVA